MKTLAFTLMLVATYSCFGIEPPYTVLTEGLRVLPDDLTTEFVGRRCSIFLKSGIYDTLQAFQLDLSGVGDGPPEGVMLFSKDNLPVYNGIFGGIEPGGNIRLEYHFDTRQDSKGSLRLMRLPIQYIIFEK